MKFLKALTQRVAEPSTHAGLGVLLGIFGLSPDATQAVVNMVGTLAGLGTGPITTQGVVALGSAFFAMAAMVLKEKNKGATP